MGAREPASLVEEVVHPAWVSAGAEWTACTKHLFRLSGAPPSRCRDHLARLLDSGYKVGDLWLPGPARSRSLVPEELSTPDTLVSGSRAGQSLDQQGDWPDLLAQRNDAALPAVQTASGGPSSPLMSSSQAREYHLKTRVQCESCDPDASAPVTGALPLHPAIE